MDLRMEIAGDVVEWQEQLNGTQTVSLAGASADGAWAMSGSVSWNIGLESNTGEGDITLARRDGAELYGTLVRGDVAEAAGPAAEDAAYTLLLEYEIDGGADEFEGASGRASGEGSLSAGEFRLTLVISS